VSGLGEHVEGMQRLQAVSGFAEVFEVVSTRRAFTLGPAIIYPNCSGNAKAISGTYLVVRMDYFYLIFKKTTNILLFQRRKNDNVMIKPSVDDTSYAGNEG